MIIVIPAYEPGPALVGLVDGLRRARPHAEVIVADDGSGPDCADVFEAARGAGAVVLTHPSNRGKGAALKSVFRHLRAVGASGPIVTADADGQHTVADILRVGDAVADGDDRTMVLGCRGFTGPVPLRSRLGNSVSRGLFRLSAGWALSDTQTGLRGIPATMLPWLIQQPGDRFEYEQNVLLRLHGGGWHVQEIAIATVYEPHNPSSHFRPVVDSLRVLIPLVTFAGSSFLAFLIDTVALLLFFAVSGMLVPSVVAARVLSASVNFAINRRLVFRAATGRDLWRQAATYSLLAAALLASNVVWMAFLTDAGVPLLLAKIVTEAVLFVTAYQAQRALVFARRPRAAKDSTAAETAHSNRIEPPVRMEEDTHIAGRLS
ncbi:bifunctional glycosyltransferase family 2/GtrA family protein [Microbacterium sp. C448]|uniref:bifunctional glycosyltransferase family 2/GtrA family protein n=1 Tax=Microbacterium sp. C448 TaxID=1177594 RepID=UPI0004B98185|nr:bifunctional glycosyltransferase family 2/GtrA family protein [Microbacterium sp. C448]